MWDHSPKPNKHIEHDSLWPLLAKRDFRDLITDHGPSPHDTSPHDPESHEPPLTAHWPDSTKGEAHLVWLSHPHVRLVATDLVATPESSQIVISGHYRSAGEISQNST